MPAHANDAPLISVLIPAYNMAAYLEEAVASVYAQGYSPLEVIIVNDGSSDDTAVVAARLQAMYPDLRYIEQDNAGVCRAAEKAFQASSGRYIIRLDADDYLPAGYINSLYKKLVGQPDQTVYAYCDAQCFGAHNELVKARPYSLAKLVQWNYIHVSALVRRDVIERRGYYNVNMAHGLEDWDFWLKLAEAGYEGVYCPDTFLYYRQKPAGGRNAMGEVRAKAMQRQVYRNQAKLFHKPINRFRVFRWRLLRRLRQYLDYIY